MVAYNTSRGGQSIKIDIGKPIDKSISIDKIEIKRFYRSIDKNRYSHAKKFQLYRFYRIYYYLSIVKESIEFYICSLVYTLRTVPPNTRPFLRGI